MTRKKIAVLLAAFAFLALGVYWWVRHGVDVAIRNITSSHELEVATKSAAASLAVADEKLQPNAPAGATKGALARYAEDPEKAQAEAQITDTWTHGLVIADTLLKASNVSLFGSSADVTGVQPKFRLDGWGHTFCYKVDQNRAIIFSAGNADALAGGCQNWRPPKITPALARGRLIRSNSGFLLIVERQEYRNRTSSGQPG
jgi:hypothetical protein